MNKHVHHLCLCTKLFFATRVPAFLKGETSVTQKLIKLHACLVLNKLFLLFSFLVVYYFRVSNKKRIVESKMEINFPHN